MGYLKLITDYLKGNSNQIVVVLFCMKILQESKKASLFRIIDQLDCVTFATPNLQFLAANLVRSSNVAVGAVLGVVACLLIVICLAVVLTKRSRYLPPGDGQMSPIFDSSLYTPSPKGIENSANGNLYTPLFVRQFEFPSTPS